MKHVKHDRDRKIVALRKKLARATPSRYKKLVENHNMIPSWFLEVLHTKKRRKVLFK